MRLGFVGNSDLLTGGGQRREGAGRHPDLATLLVKCRGPREGTAQPRLVFSEQIIFRACGSTEALLSDKEAQRMFVMKAVGGGGP